jgi:hypothetical protein
MPSIRPELQKIMGDCATQDLGGTASAEAVNLKTTSSARWLSVIKTPVAIASMAALLMLSACAGTSKTTQPKEQTMNTTSTNQPETPHLTAEQATLTALRFIGSLRTEADLNPERFKEVTGVQLRSYPESEGRFVFGEGAADGWAYSMEIYKHFQQLFAFEFGFHQAEGGRENTPMTKICTVDLQRFQAEMLKMGFVHAYDTRVNIMNRVFKKGGWYVSVGYVGESEQNPDHLCISRVLVASTDR